MNVDIKEIREYIACPQFGDDHYGIWGALRLDQRIKIKQLLDYITNLQEERDFYRCTDSMNMESNIKLRDIINKAIEYIENNQLYENEWNYDEYDCPYQILTDENAKSNLLSILRGEEDD